MTVLVEEKSLVGDDALFIVFRVDELGSFPLVIQNEDLFDASAEPVGLGGIDWSAGSLVGS